MAYNLGPVKSHVAAAASELGPRFGITSIGGYRQDPLPGGDHPKGLALDFMTRDKRVGDALAAELVANSGRLGVTYVIWYRRIWSANKSAQGWRVYTGTPNPHTDHVHASFSDRPGTGGPSTTPVGLPGVDDIAEIGRNIRALMEVARDVGKAAAWLNDRKNWIRIGLFVGGSSLVFISIVRWDNAVDAVASGVKKVTNG